MMARKRMAPVGLLLLLLLGVSGCGDSTMSDVSGKVTLDGKPVEQGVISFYPMDGKTSTTGGSIKDGTYLVKVPIGVMEVKISMPKVVGKKKLYDAANSPERTLTAEALPPRYNDKSELRLEVTPGKVEKDWELKSD